MENEILINNFKEAYRNFPQNYQNDFDDFWLWRNKIETKTEHILDRDHLDGTFNRLSPILKKWQYNRGPKCDEKPLDNLKLALNNISEEYAKIRNLSLLDISQFELELFQKIWNEIGDVKIIKKEEPDENPLVISICKPLMLIWGQTLAFDTKVRKNFSYEYEKSFLNKYRWSSNEWLYSLYLSNSLLKENKKFTEYLRTCSIKKYGKDCPVPYGRFLDIYYFSSRKKVNLKKCEVLSDNSLSNDSSENV